MRVHRRRPKVIKRLIQKPRGQGSVDYVLIGTIFFILVFGLAMLASASSNESFRNFGSIYYLFRHQLLFGLLPGMILFFIFSRVDYRRWERHAFLFYAALIGLLLLVFVPGVGAHYGRAQSWLNLGGFSFQPSEIGKLFLIIALAAWFAQRGRGMNANFWNGLIPFTLLVGVPAGLIVLQPDIGTLFVVMVVATVMYFVAGARWKHILGLGVLGVGTLAVLIVKAPYRLQRLMTFINPELDPQGIGYQINQAFLAVGSGGWLGLGYSQSRQKLAYLPEVMGDSIFAVIAEEIGFIFSAILIIAFLTLFLRGLKLAQRLDDEYAQYLVIGIVSWFTLQAFLNIAAMVGLMPLTGIPLPFVSYGGTALMSSLAATGILANISRSAH